MPAKEITKNSYLERINKVLNYIQNHLDEELSVKYLAGISCFSQFHFHRIMSAFLGESLKSYIIRQRLELSISFLRYSEMPISDISYKIAYETPSSYTKAFKKMYGISPNEFRKTKQELDMKNVEPKEKHINFQPNAEILNVESKKVIYNRIFGEYSKEMDYAGSWNRVCGFAGLKGMLDGSNEFIAVYYDNPEVTPAGKQRCDCCVSINNEIESNGDIGFQVLEGGKFAKFRYQGPYHYLSEVYDSIYGQWLPTSGEDVRMSPSWEIYLNSPENTTEDKLITELYIPIK